MPSQPRQKRIPISCEPCRMRKIRCNRPRGPPPCDTCVRRALVSRCVYADRDEPPSPAQPALPPSPLSEPSTSARSFPVDESLVTRVAKLEALLQMQGSTERALPIAQLALPSREGKGKLCTSESGHVRFMPSSRFSDSDQSLSQLPQATCNLIDLSSGPYPFGTKQIDIDHLLTHLPARGQCSQLKCVFFESFASLFHVLHDPTFEEQYAEFERAPKSTPLAWLALLYAMLGTAVNALGPSSQLLHDLSRETTTSRRIAELSQRFRNAAMKCLEADNYMWQQNITTLQALIILIYGINHSHGQTWTLLGMTYHIALSLGCHVDPDEFALDVVRAEERRRCWAGVMMLYMLQNTSLGRLGPDPRHASEGVRLPADVNDSDLTAEDHVPPITSGVATQMSYLLLKFRLYSISTDICSLVLSMSQPPVALIERMDRAIQEERHNWNEKYLGHSRAGFLMTCHEAHLDILYGYGHQLILLLHHCSLRTVSRSNPQYRRSVAKCIESSQELLRIHDVFCSRTEYTPFAWYLRGVCSFHAFHAFVSLVALWANNCVDEDQFNPLPLLRKCAARFESLIQASSICEKATPILRHMLNTLQNWPINTSEHGSNSRAVSQNALPMHQVQTASQSTPGFTELVQAGGHVEASQAEPHVTGDMFHYPDPQSWLTSTGIAWDQWDVLQHNI